MTKISLSIIASAALLALTACGGGGSDAAAPAPAPAPSQAMPPPPAAQVVAPAPEAPKTWKDADCSRADATALPKCGLDFSANNARTTLVTESGAPAIELETIAGLKATTPSPINGKLGHKAMFGLGLLHEVALADYPGISFEMKLNTGDSTIQDDAYVTTAVSLTCDGANWLNLITMTRDMAPQPAADGYTRYTAKIDEVKWYRTGAVAFPATGTALLNGVLGSVVPLTLDALRAAYPKACIYNWPHPTTTITPAVQVILGDSDTVKAKKAWLRSVTIGDKSIF